MSEYIALFFSQNGAVKYNSFLKKQNLQGVMLPTPRNLSSSCGIAVRFNYDLPISNILIEDIDKIYLIKEGGSGKVYELCYQSEE